MPHSVQCNRCGKLLSISSRETATTILCTACGQTIANPHPAPPSNPAAAEASAKVAQPAEISAGRRLPLAWIAAVAAGVAAIVLSLILVFVLARDPHRVTRAELEEMVRLKSEAERLAVAGDLRAALERYQEIERRIGGRHITDSAFFDLAERAKGDQDRIYRILVDRQDRTAAKTAPATAPTSGDESIAIATQPYPPQFKLLEPAPPPASRPATVSAPRQPARPVTLPAVPVAAAPARPPVARMKIDEPFTDAAVGEAMRRGTEFLMAQFQGDQVRLDKKPNNTYLEGLNALAVYSLLRAGGTLPDERLKPSNVYMKRLLERMKDHIMLVDQANPGAPVTYARSLRAAALGVYNRPEDRAALAADVQWLIKASAHGAYTYNDGIGRWDQRRPIAPGRTNYSMGAERPRIWLHNGELRVPAYPALSRIFRPVSSASTPLSEQYSEPPELPWDNSNSQYGALGVGSGAEAGIEVPPAYWENIEKHWLSTQLSTGEWDYNGKQERGSFAMTMGGIASLMLAHEHLDAMANADGGIPLPAGLVAAMALLDRGNNVTNATSPPMHFIGYNLFGLSRVGMATGFKHFGDEDWYRYFAQRLLKAQSENGSWGRDKQGAGAIIDTSYILLFLANGRSPVMMNKLRFDGSWNNRTRDLANLSRFAARELERPLNWQVVGINRGWEDLADAPVLFIASSAPPRFKDEDYAKLRQYVDAGGLIFTHADGSSYAFNAFVEEMARKLFPGRLLANLPQQHEVYSMQFAMKTKPALKAVSNGSRLLLIHSPSDLSGAWQSRNGSQRANFELGTNIFLYAAGKPELRNRLATTIIPPVAEKPAFSATIARIRHEGDWDPEPYAWVRFAWHFQRETSWGLEVKQLKPAELQAAQAPVAHLTGAAPLVLSPQETTALKSYVESGGVLIIEAFGGSAPFLQSAGAFLAQAFPGQKPQPLAATHALMRGLPGSVDLSRPLLRTFAQDKLGGNAPGMELLQAGKGMVIIVPLDLSTALLGTNTWSILGYRPEYAQGFLTNLLVTCNTSVGAP